GLRRGRNARRDRLQLLECMAALAGDLLIHQRRPQIDRRGERLVELEHVVLSVRFLRKRLVLDRIDRSRGAQLLLLGDHFLDRGEDVFHRWFAAGLHPFDDSFNAAAESRATWRSPFQPRSEPVDAGGGGIPGEAGTGVTPVEPGGAGLSRAGMTCGVTTGFAGISCGLTVRVACGTWAGSVAQSFQLL